MKLLPTLGYSWIEEHTPWVKQPILSALFVITLTLLLAFPDAHRFTHWQPSWEEEALDWKLQHPLSAIPAREFAKPSAERIGIVSHLHKRTYRITMPLVAYFLKLDIRETETLCIGLSIAFSVVILLYFRRMLPENPLTALFLTVSLACSTPGQWGTCMPIYFDSAGYLLLALAVYTESPSLVALFMVLGGFSDERVILAAPVVYLLDGTSLKPSQKQGGILAGVIVFVALRLILGLHIGKQLDTSLISLNLHYLVEFPLQLLLVYKGAVLVMAVGFIYLAMANGLNAFLLILCTIPGILGSVLVGDVPRALAYTFPTFLACSAALCKFSRTQTLQRVAILAALLSACLPTYYLLPWQHAIQRLPNISRLLGR
jgi:hypothetical protein